LSVALYPLNGQFLANQAAAWKGWTGWNWKSLHNVVSRMGLWAQLGLSLTDPTKHMFVGAATDPVPGVTLAIGEHYGYVDTPNYPVNGAVPPSQAATRKQWQHGTAATLTVDAGVIITTFGAILGIK